MTQVLSYQICDMGEKHALEVVLQSFELASLPVNLVHLGQGRQARKVRAFLDFATPRLRKRLRYES